MLYYKHPAYVPLKPTPNAETAIEGFPTTNLKLWVDAATIDINLHGTRLKKWESKTLDGEYFFTSNSPPIIYKFVKSKLPILHFNTDFNMQLNKPLYAEEYTFAFVARQTGGGGGFTNNRFFVGSGNRLLGYWAGRKGVVHLEGWQGSGNGPASNDEWDLMILRRDADDKCTISRNGKVLQKNVNGGRDFNHLYINSGPKHAYNGELSEGQVAEILFWNRCITDQETLFIENYLSSKWMLTSIMDPTHKSYVKPVDIPDAIVPPVKNFPTLNTQVWFDATTYKNSNDTKLRIWGSKTKIKKYYLNNTTNDSNQWPTIKKDTLNGLPVIDFTTKQHLVLSTH